MKENKNYPIIIADSQFLVVESLKSLIEINDRYYLAGIAWNRNELYDLLEVSQNALLITDFVNIDFDGPGDLKNIKNKYPQISILVLTNSITNIEFSALRNIGIKNIIYKTSDKEELVRAIDAALKGENFYSEELLELPDSFRHSKFNQSYQNQLTTSEFEIVRLIAGGLTTKKIATKKNISYHTVNTHRRNIFKKVEVSNSNELILHAIKSGWIENIEYFI